MYNRNREITISNAISIDFYMLRFDWHGWLDISWQPKEQVLCIIIERSFSSD